MCVTSWVSFPLRSLMFSEVGIERILFLQVQRRQGDLLFVRMRRGTEEKLFTTEWESVHQVPSWWVSFPVNNEEWQISRTRKKEGVHLKSSPSQKGSYGRDKVGTVMGARVVPDEKSKVTEIKWRQAAGPSSTARKADMKYS